ncbi:MAG: ATP-grasp domain-containing protein [Candidatus Tectomicrobia bacterium]|nr:ATP-grasp domain-containing protein [Candidatus Tectomicrobia bacterium]
MDEKRLLLLFATTGYEGRDFAAAAQRLGVAVTLGTDHCHSLDDPWHDGALALRFNQPRTAARVIERYAREHPIHGIVAVGDLPVRTAALASARLGLPHNPSTAAAACRNKYLARRLLRAAGVSVPPFARFPLDADAADAARQVAYPCVLKPLALSASRGVVRAGGPAEFVVAFRRVAALLRTAEVRVRRDEADDWILVEGYLEGREATLEGLLDNGVLRVLAIFDKPDPLEGPFFEETLFVTPSREDAATQAAMVKEVDRACRALGLVRGPIHAELRLTPQGPRILEIAARAIGGLCSRTLRFGTGMSLEELIIRHALGLEIEPRREDRAVGVMMLPIERPGIYERVEGIEAARAVDGIDEVTITAKSSQALLPLPEGGSYLGFIFARGDSPQQVEQALRQAHRALRFTVSPILPVAAAATAAAAARGS